MKIDTAYLTQQDAQQQSLLTRSAGTCVIQIEPGDTLENVLVALRFQAYPGPVILVLPEQGRLFDDPAPARRGVAPDLPSRSDEFCHTIKQNRNCGTVCPLVRLSFCIIASKGSSIASRSGKTRKA